MRPAGPGVKLTYDDYVLFPDDGMRHELIDGERYVTPTPLFRHQRISGNLHFLIRSHLEASPIGQIYYAPVAVVLSLFDVVEPDLLYFSNERMAEVVTTKEARGAPNLLVEIASPSTRQRDETIKRHLYERAGVSEYWIVDPEIDVVRVYRRVEDGFGKPFELSCEAGDVFTTPLLPGLEMPLARIFKD